jgi:hypothetical protein
MKKITAGQGPALLVDVNSDAGQSPSRVLIVMSDRGIGAFLQKAIEMIRNFGWANSPASSAPES